MLIILQALFFILLNFIKSIYVFSALREAAFYNNIYHWFVMPADLQTLLTRPWTFFTMPFTEVRMITVIGNIIWLWTFGHLVQDLIGGDKLFPVYLYSASVGALVFLVSAHLLPDADPLRLFFSGVGPAIMGLALAATSIAPGYRFFPMIGGGIPLWVITLVYALLQFSSVSSDLLLLLPLLAAAAAGYGFIFFLKQGHDLGAWMNRVARQVEDLFKPSSRKSNPSGKRFAAGSNRYAPKKNSGITQQQVDAVLDKIAQQGFDKLTAEEKSILERASKQDL